MTDHHSLCWLTGLKYPSGRLARWALRLQEYDISIIYKNGKQHKDADSLSRNPVEDEIHNSERLNILSPITNIAEEQMKDPDLSKLIDAKRNSELMKVPYELVDGILCKKNFDPYPKKRGCRSFQNICVRIYSSISTMLLQPDI